MDRHSDFRTATRRPESTRRATILLFAIGSLMLVIPVGTVLTENSICRASASACNHTDAYRYLVSSFPYVMLSGGLLIGYNMKRISDAMNFNQRNEEMDSDYSDPLV